MQTIREHLKDIPGSERTTMRYEGDKQVFSINDTSVTVGPTATPEDIRAAFLEAMK
jgi:hypothetical protein